MTGSSSSHSQLQAEEAHSQEPEQLEFKDATPLALPPPPPPSATDTKTLDVTQSGSGSGSVKFDELGPLVVNSDGTLSRIANWQSMTEEERERTMRVLVARNKVRLANQEARQGEGTS